ncbi:RNA polymerase beta subunit [Vibrio phage Aphrodite1]|uniref:Putative RNA polymerase beta subunit n=1 Tax=Vibrio phage Aphrodite1 TaxID=2070057 RepID=A0A2I7QHM6_9CAUD|nr:RNA polymerase beta subunit [Vibrio phage Aphrodite1]AUR80913.1 putative RNA polymerase beta subunit [Vibrio phage Aphrodite1]
MQNQTPLDSEMIVDGLEALYPLFFKEFVLRRKNDLTNPRYHSLSDIELPRGSMLFYYPKHANDLGPSNQEPLINTYPDVVNIGFDSHYVIESGKARPAPLDERKQIQRYRNGHFRYKYARNIKTPMGRSKELIVVNNALGQLKWNYVPDRFLAFNKSYNQLASLLDVINTHAQGNDRQLFFRMELPNQIPIFTKFLEYFRHYEKCFELNEKGEVTFIGPNDQAIRDLKRTGAFWLLDWFAWLSGKYEYSLFDRLDPSVMERLNIVFTKHGKTVILKPGLLRTWLDELNKVVKVDGEEQIDYNTSQRQNAVKRTLAMFMRMIAQANAEVETDDDNTTSEKASTTKDGDGPNGADGSEEEESGEETPDVDPATDTDLFDDFLNGRKTHVDGPDGQSGEEPRGSGSGSDPESDQEVVENWTDELDDTEFVTEETVTSTKRSRMVDESPEAGIKRAIERKVREGQLTKSQQDFFLKQAERYKDLAMPNGQTLEEFMKIDEKALRDLPSKVAPEMIGVQDESYLNSTVTHLKKGYVEHFMQKDIVRAILAVQQAGICVTNFEQETVHNVDGTYDVYRVQFHPVGGTPVTRSFRIARVDKEGTFTVDGKKRTKALQRMDLPIRKMDDYRVGLNSYYGRKLIISRSKMAADDYGLWLSKQVRKRALRNDFELLAGNSYTNQYALPRPFTALSRRFKGINVNGAELMFDVNAIIKRDESLADQMTAESAVIGFKDKTPIKIDQHGMLTAGKEDLGSIESFLGIDVRKAPLDTANININGYRFPMGVVLSYYFGFDELLQVLEIEPRVIPGGVRVKLESDEFALRCADETLVFSRRDPMASLIFGGMAKLNNLHSFNRVDMNDPGIWVTAIDNPRVKPAHFQEMTNLLDMFIDPITHDELKRLGHATSFDYLLIEAVEMLRTEQHEHEVEIKEQRFIGYESFAGAIYHQMTSSARQYRGKAMDRRAKFDLNPEAIMMEACLSDTSVDMVQEVNPIHEIKEQETVTFGGNNGRNDVSMVRRTRGQLPTYKGIISEAGKDSSKVGYVTYTTSNPKVTDFRGNVDLSRDVGNAGLGSVTMNLMPGANKDDPKRTLFSGVQHSQGTSAVNYTPNIMRGPYDMVVAHRTSELYSKPAKQNGKVLELTNEGIKVEYEDGTIDAYPLGIKLGDAAGEVHRHNRVTDLTPGDAFKAGDILGWDEVYFQRDTLNPRQVVWKCGVMTRIAMIENQFTFEDSIEISKEFAEETKTSYVLGNKFYLNFDQGLDMHVDIGSEVDYDTILCHIEDASLVGVENPDDDFGELDRLGARKVKSNHHGKVVKIDVRYNGDINEMSEPVKKFVMKHDRLRKRNAAITGDGVVNGNVAGSRGMRTSLEPNQVSIEVFVEEFIETSTVDKFVIGNQMKGTVGNIFPREYFTQDGRKIQILFSFKSLFNRMVLSLRDKLVTNELVIHGQQQMIDIYRGN